MSVIVLGKFQFTNCRGLLGIFLQKYKLISFKKIRIVLTSEGKLVKMSFFGTMSSYPAWKPIRILYFLLHTLVEINKGSKKSEIIKE